MAGVIDSLAFVAAAAENGGDDGGNPLLEASPGLMIWTVVMFFLTLYILKRYVFGPLSATIEKRRAQIEQSIHEAESSRDEAVRLLDEYKTRLAEARKEADEFRDRGRRDGERERASIVTAAEGQRERILADTQQQVDAQSRAALASVRGDVASIALAAAEKVTRKTLSDDDHRRLVEEALQEIDLAHGGATQA
jgi:F-type H+-transporting ATPase subunit b